MSDLSGLDSGDGPEPPYYEQAPGRGSFDRNCLQPLLEAAKLAAPSRAPQDVLEQLAPRVSRLTGCNFLSISVHDGRDCMLTRYWKENQDSGDFDPFPVSACVAGWVWQSQDAVVLPDLQREDRFPVCISVLRQHGVRSYHALPLTASGRRFGVLGLGKATPEVPNAERLQFLSSTAHMVTLALENHDRLRSEQRQKERWQTLFESSAALAQSKLNLQDLSPQIAAHVRKIVPHDLALISVPDDDGQNVRIIALEASIPGVSCPGLRIPKHQCLSSEIGPGESRLFRRAELAALAGPYPVVARAVEQGFQRVWAAHLRTARASVGVLYLASKQEDALQSCDVEMLRPLTAQLALLIENALTHQALSEEKERLQMWLEINTALNSGLDLRELFPLIAASVRKVVQHDHAALNIWDETLPGLRVYALDSNGTAPDGDSGPIVCPADSTAGRCFRTQEPQIYHRGDLETNGLVLIPPFASWGVRSLCCVPLVTPTGTVGTLSLASREDDAFVSRDLQVLAPIASQVAAALHHARIRPQTPPLKERLSREQHYSENELKETPQQSEIVGKSPLLKRALDQASIVAGTDTTVLITGETGTGKELIARVIHGMSCRKGRNFIKLNCAAIPTGLLESELFGHEKGAFTGAISQKVGRLELADKGTLLLDEVGDIPLELQPKLLRVLQDQEFERLGSTRTIHVDVRIIAATNRDLAQAVQENEFRRDLYYRLHVFPVHLAPLRERRDDIPVLVRHFVDKFAQRLRRHIDIIPDEAVEAMLKWTWPGNIRELENFIERSVILSEGSTLRPPLSELRPEVNRHESGSGTTLREKEREHILEALRQTSGVLSGPSGAAARLGLKRTTLQYKIQRLGISRMEYLD